MMVQSMIIPSNIHKKLADASKLQEQVVVRNNPNLDPNKFQAPVIRSKETPVFYQGRYMSVREWTDIKAKERRIQLTQSYGLKDPVPQVRKGGVSKKAAGQSQIMERLKLIRFIAGIIKSMKATPHMSRNARQSSLKIAQQKLVNLLARYRF